MTSVSGIDPASIEPRVPTRRVLNVKAAVILAMIVAAVVISAKFLHGIQRGGTVNFLHQSAAAAFEQQRYDEAVEMLENYLALQSTDEEARDLLLEAISKANPTPAGMLKRMAIHEEILLRNPDRLELRKRQIQMAVQLRRMPDAEAHLNILLEDPALADAETYWLAGQYHEASENPREAMAAYEAALATEPPCGRAAGCLARLLRKVDRDTVAADVVMNRLVNQHDSAESRALRAEWLLDTERPAEAIGDLRLALGLIEPDVMTTSADEQTTETRSAKAGDGHTEPERWTLLRLLIKATAAEAEQARQRGGQEAARAVLTPTIELLAKDAESGGLAVESSLLLASLLWTAEEREAATNTLRESLRRFPDHSRTQRMLVDVLLAQGKFDDAERVFRTVSREQMDRADYEFLRARLLLAQGHTAEAIQILQVIVNGLALDSALRERAQTALAIASTSAGDRGVAFDEFRLLVQHNPQTESGRLGLAAGYVARGRHDLAIAEYRQLMHVSGVPPYLAHLLIDQSLTLPASVRPWEEIEDLLREENPPVSDPLQREILRTDMAFARGHISEALRRLSEARRAWPNRSEADFAARFLREERTEQVESVLLENLRIDPLETRYHIELLLFRMVTGRSEAALQWLGSVVNGDAGLLLPEADRLRLAIDIGSAATEEMRSLGTNTSSQAAIAAIDGLAERWLQELSSKAETGNDVLRHTQFLISRDRWLDAFEVVARAADSVPVEVRGEALLELDRSIRKAVTTQSVGNDDTEKKKRLAESIGTNLLSLVNANPQNVTLQLQLAELLIRHNQLDAAEDIYRELLTAFPDETAVVNNLAWLLSIRGKDVRTALQLSEQALRLDADSFVVRETRAAALLAAGYSEDALSVLQSIPPDHRTAVSDIRLALALFRTGQQASARQLLEQMDGTDGNPDTLTPPDREFVEQATREIAGDGSAT